jgi:hypothetical protein
VDWAELLGCAAEHEQFDLILDSLMVLPPVRLVVDLGLGEHLCMSHLDADTVKSLRSKALSRLRKKEGALFFHGNELLGFARNAMQSR